MSESMRRSDVGGGGSVVEFQQIQDRTKASTEINGQTIWVIEDDRRFAEMRLRQKVEQMIQAGEIQVDRG